MQNLNEKLAPVQAIVGSIAPAGDRFEIMDNAISSQEYSHVFESGESFGKAELAGKVRSVLSQAISDPSQSQAVETVLRSMIGQFSIAGNRWEEHQNACESQDFSYCFGVGYRHAQERLADEIRSALDK